MSRTVTLAALEDAIRFQADLIGATVRHTSAQVRTLINTSIQGFREEISNDGNTHYLVPYSGTLTAGATSPYSFLSLDLSAIPTSIVRTYGLDITVDGVVHSLDHRPFTERNIWSGPATTGIPRHWAHYQTAKLAIQPAPNATYPYTLWYLPVLADLSGDSATFDGVAGWEDWIVWDVVCRLLIRDQQAPAFGVAKTYRDDVWTRIKRQATRVSSAGGAVVGRDTLRGRIPDPLAARQAVMAGGGPPATHSITLAMLAEQTGPVFLGRISGTGDVQAFSPSGAASILPLFSPSGPGLVPPSGGSSTTKFLSQAGTFEAVSGGGGAGNSVGPSGAIQYQAGTGFAGASGFRIFGASPSMVVALGGSLRVTGGGVDVGSGTVRMSASGIDFGGGQIANVSSLFAFPTFAAGVPGLVPASDQDSTKFLNAAGGFAVPPGTSSANPGGPLGAVQFQNSVSAFDGASGITIQGSGAAGTEAGGGVALVFGAPTLAGGGLGTIRANGQFSIFGSNPSGSPLRLLSLFPTGASTTATGGAAVLYGSNTSTRFHQMEHLVATGGQFLWRIGGNSSGTPAILSPSGFDLSGFRVAARSLTVSDGIPNSELVAVPSGTVKGSLSNASPSDLPIPTLAAYFPTFTANRAGLVPTSDGDSTKFLNAVGAFAVPPGVGGSTPTGVTNAQHADMPSGTVKARLTGTGAPQDVLIPTLFMYAPTFTATRPGVVAPGDGDTNKFLNAAGLFATPPVGGTPSGLALSQLAPIATPRILGRVSALSGIPEELTVAQVATMIPEFTASTKGTVPLSGGGLVNFLRADGNFAAPTGFVWNPTGLPNANLAAMPSGTVKANLSGTAAPADVLIPTLFMHAPTMTSARAGIVGPGGGNLAQFLRGDGAFAAPTGFTSTPTGLPNANLSVMPSGTVKANLTGTGVPADVLIPTLMMHFPTFTSARAGIVAPGDGDTGKFLNAGGLFTTPVAAATPGGVAGNVQWNNAGAMAGASGVHVLVGGENLAIGPAALVADRGDLRVASGFMLAARNPSGIAQPMLEWFGQSGMLRVGSSALPRQLSEVASGGVQEFGFGGATASTARLLPTGFDIRNFHLTVKSIDVGHINGLPFDFAALKRFPSLISGNSLPSGVQLFVPRGNATGGNRFVIPSGSVGASRTITLRPSGARGGQVIRVERQDESGFDVNVATPTGTVLHVFGSGVRAFGDFMFTKPSGPNFELAGHGDLF